MFQPGAGHNFFHTFTREFCHPPDRLPQASPQAADRFNQDSKRFPPAAYEEHSLVWNKEAWRQLTPAERAQLHGLPVSLIEHLQGSDNSSLQHKVALRNSAVGNGFHMPSLMLALFILLQMANVTEATAPLRGLADAQEEQLQSTIFGTAFDPIRGQSLPGPAGRDRHQVLHAGAVASSSSLSPSMGLHTAVGGG